MCINDQQLLFDLGGSEVTYETVIEHDIKNAMTIPLLPLNEYDHVIVSISGGKDSVASTLWLLEEGVDPQKIEWWHQSIDGNFQDRVEFMDWPVTEAYVQSLGEVLGINKVVFQWRENGIYGELMRTNSLTNDVLYSDNGKIVRLPTKQGKLSTRRKWPAQGADLRTRWCSAYLKIDVFRRVLNNHPSYSGTLDKPKKILVVTGERWSESAARSRYKMTELHACNTQSRIVHAFRPVIHWSERDIWDMYEKWRITPHPAYLLGYPRTSCFSCIFLSPDLWAICRELAPERFNMLVEKEKELNHTINSNRIPLTQLADMGNLNRLPKDKRLSKWVDMAFSRSFSKDELIMDKWKLPAGAFGQSVGGPI